jgi:hypothetical protein
MRRCMAISRIFLCLSIVGFALAAPVVVRGMHEVHVNVADVTEDGTATSQKRWDDWLANAADQTSALTAPRLYDSELHNPRPSKRPNNAPSSSALSTGPHRRVEDDTPQPSSWSPDYSPIPWSPGQTLPSSPEYPRPTSLSTDYSPPPSTDNSRPPSPDYSPPSSPPLTGPHQFTDDHPLSISDPPVPALPTEPETKDFLSQLDPPRAPPSPAWPETKDFLSQLDPPRDPPSPSEPETTKDFLSQLGPGSSQASHSTESETKDFLSHFFKGKFKRRISGSGAVNSEVGR